MKAESKTAPARVTVERSEELVDIILTENVETIIKEEEEVYRYDEYRIPVTDRPGLEESVIADFDAWILLARENENKVPEAGLPERVASIETTTDEILSLLEEVIL